MVYLIGCMMDLFHSLHISLSVFLAFGKRIKL